MQFKERVMVITGGGNGIGAAAAAIFAKDGAAVVLGDIDDKGGTKVREDILRENGRAEYIHTDVKKLSDIKNLIECAVKEFGRLDFLINNAGIGTDYSVLDLTPEEWDRTNAINLKSAFFACQYALPQMKRQKFGRIVNMASQAGQNGGVLAGCDYAASKAGVIAITKRIAKEAGPFNITANAIAPGTIATDMILRMEPERYEQVAASTPLRRLGRPEEVASVMRFLCSDDASFVSGATIDVNGGSYIRA